MWFCLEVGIWRDCGFTLSAGIVGVWVWRREEWGGELLVEGEEVLHALALTGEGLRAITQAHFHEKA